MKSIGTPYFRPRIQSLAVRFGKTVQHFWRQWMSKLHRPSFSHQHRSPVWGNPRAVFISTCNMLSLKLPPELNQSSDVESIVALLKGHFLRCSMLQISPLALHPGHKKRLFLLVYISIESLSSSSHKNKQASHCSCYRSSPRECLKAQGGSGSSPSSPASTALLGEAHTAWLSGAVQSSAGFQTLYLQAFDGTETSWKAQV